MATVLHKLDALRGRPIVRRLDRLPGVQRTYRASRGQIVHERARFAVNELVARKGPFRYRLRNHPGQVVIRHGPSDVAVLDEFFWWGFYDPPAEVTAALGALERPPTIVDLGGHVGIFGVWARDRWPGTRITSVEADVENAEVCARTIAANGAGAEWTLVRAAASNGEGSVSFSGGNRAQSRIEDGAGIPTRAIDVLPLLEQADLAKIDIEGAEWNILDDPRFADIPARAVTLEYHPHLAPGEDARSEAERLLTRAGFGNHSVAELPDGLGMIWAWR